MERAAARLEADSSIANSLPPIIDTKTKSMKLQFDAGTSTVDALDDMYEVPVTAYREPPPKAARGPPPAYRPPPPHEFAKHSTST